MELTPYFGDALFLGDVVEVVSLHEPMKAQDPFPQYYFLRVVIAQADLELVFQFLHGRE